VYVHCDIAYFHHFTFLTRLCKFQAYARAKEDMKAALSILDSHLLTRTYLVGERITLADIVISCNLLNLYKFAFDPDFRKPFVNVNRWFTTLINQPQFKTVLGQVQFLDKVAQPFGAAQGGNEGKKSVKMFISPYKKNY
jgi:elongation factor 1-gamma